MKAEMDLPKRCWGSVGSRDALAKPLEVQVVSGCFLTRGCQRFH